MSPQLTSEINKDLNIDLYVAYRLLLSGFFILLHSVILPLSKIRIRIGLFLLRITLNPIFCLFHGHYLTAKAASSAPGPILILKIYNPYIRFRYGSLDTSRLS